MNSTRPFFVRTGTGSEAASTELSIALNEWMERNGPNALFRTCGGCKNMAHGGPPVCSLYQTTPPVDIILAGCDAWADDQDIPF